MHFSAALSILDHIKGSLSGLVFPVATFVLSTLFASSIAIIIGWLVSKKQVRDHTILI